MENAGSKKNAEIPLEYGGPIQNAKKGKKK